MFCDGPSSNVRKTVFADEGSVEPAGFVGSTAKLESRQVKSGVGEGESGGAEVVFVSELGVASESGPVLIPGEFVCPEGAVSVGGVALLVACVDDESCVPASMSEAATIAAAIPAEIEAARR